MWVSSRPLIFCVIILGLRKPSFLCPAPKIAPGFVVGVASVEKTTLTFESFLSCPWHIDHGTGNSANYGILTLPFTIRTLSCHVEFFLVGYRAVPAPTGRLSFLTIREYCEHHGYRRIRFHRSVSLPIFGARRPSGDCPLAKSRKSPHPSWSFHFRFPMDSPPFGNIGKSIRRYGCNH